ncbi:hypothetical protein FQZ97_944200 [compost metagenome]
MLRQLHRQAETLAHSPSQPEQDAGQASPEQDDHREIEDNRRQVAPTGQTLLQLGAGQQELVAPQRHRAVGALEALLQIAQGVADQAQHAAVAFLALLGDIAQLLQLLQQISALLVVLQGLDYLVQRLFELGIADLLPAAGTTRQRIGQRGAALRRVEQTDEQAEQQQGQKAGMDGRHGRHRHELEIPRKESGRPHLTRTAAPPIQARQAFRRIRRQQGQRRPATVLSSRGERNQCQPFSEIS